MSDGLKALKYAEDTLGVHRVFADARDARNTLDGILTDLGKARDAKRDLEFRQSDIEQLIVAAEFGKHPDMAQWRMDRHVKAAFHESDDWREVREQIGRVVGDIEGLEYDKTVAEVDLKIAVARMHELDGYLQYLSVIKQAELKHSENSNHSRETGQSA